MEIVEEVDEDGSGTIDFDGMNVERSHFNHGLIVILYSFTFFLNYFFVFFNFRVYGHDDGMNTKTVYRPCHSYPIGLLFGSDC